MCCLRFTISASYRKEVERHLQTAQRLGHVRQVKYLASITASATFGHSASPYSVTCWYIMAFPCALKIYVKYSDNFLSPELIAFQSLTNVFLFQ